VSRIEEATVVEEPVVRPPHFNLAEYWEASKERYVASLPVYLATLRMDPELNTGLRQFGRPKRIERQEPPGPDGWPTVVMRFDVFDEAVEAILGWGLRVEVLEPLELRERVIELAKGVVEMYE
jgi:predicted DNA-binding transcriptional regulator YafY